jgi:hypothetical protein
MKTAVILLLGIFLSSCAAGPVMLAKSEGEAIKRVYTDPELSKLSQKYQPLLHELYARFTLAQVNVYPDGIGFTTTADRDGKAYHYLQVQLRPREINFNGNKSTSRERFSTVVQRYFPANMRFIKKEDIDRSDIDGLAFAIFWPVRDFSQCDSNGGFIEYAQVYMSKADVFDILNGSASFLSVAEESEVIASLDMAKPVSIKIVEK